MNLRAVEKGRNKPAGLIEARRLSNLRAQSTKLPQVGRQQLPAAEVHFLEEPTVALRRDFDHRWPPRSLTILEMRVEEKKTT